MINLLSEITELLLENKSIVLVGSSNSGKTYWIKNTLIPYLESQGKEVRYLEDGDAKITDSADIVICDETETLFDEDFLQDKNTEEYLNKVNRWYKNYSELPASTLFVVTRNESDQIENLLQNFNKADWDGRDVVVLRFKK
ncbi:MAG: hypothetical protein AAB374_01535 [Patescibacteria group bacterium]